MEEPSEDMLRCTPASGGDITDEKQSKEIHFENLDEKTLSLDAIRPENNLDLTTVMSPFRCRSVSSSCNQSVGGCDSGDINEIETSANRRKSLCEYNVANMNSSPGSGGIPKGIFAKSLRYSSSGGASTRKCVLTLDGYSYVIVASTPENRLNREETEIPTKTTSPLERGTSRAGESEKDFAWNSVKENSKIENSTTGTRTAFAPEDTERTNTEIQTSLPQQLIASPVNDQISNQSSLTIVRRSSGRKVGQQSSDNTYGNKYQQQQQQQQQFQRSSASTINIDIHSSNITSSSVKSTEKEREISNLVGRPQSIKMQAPPATSTTISTTTNNSTTSTATTSFSVETSPTTTIIESEYEGLSSKIVDDGERSCDNMQISTGLLPCSPVDLATENLPAVDTPDACDKAALRLRSLLRLLQSGEISAEILQNNLHYAARVLESVFIDETKRLADDDDELSEVQPDAVPPEVREWLASTFTRQLATTRKRNDEKPKFRSVAHAIRAGIFVDRIYRRVSSSALMQFPPEVVKVLKTLDDWSFDVFALAEAANGQPVKYLGYDLLNRYGIIHKFKIAPVTLETFLNRIEEGYCRYRNPYHNNLHAADVTQTVHHMLCQTGLMNWLTDLEIFATLLAALVHDYEHTGTTNNFHVMSGSDTALLYNDRAVLENHHISAAFRVLKDDDCNVLSNLSREEFRELRTLIIDMVLSTDMSFHFQQLKNMKNLLTLPEPTVDKSKALALVLHCCDISHPAKRWNLHHRWTMLLLEEFFRQGDLERELGLPFSPLCDRNNTLVAESQIGFIDFIVDPSMSVCADMLEHVLAPITPICKNTNASIDMDNTSSSSSSSPASKSFIGKPPNQSSQCEAIAEVIETETKISSSDNNNATNNNEENGPLTATPAMVDNGAGATKQKFQIRKPWMSCLTENKKIWKEQAVKDAEARAAAIEIKNVDEESSNDQPKTDN